MKLERKILNQSELEDCLEFWQKELALEAWQIKAEIAKEADMPIEDTQGTVQLVESIRTAKIFILAPEDFDGMHEFNMEQCLIHELLHVKTWAIVGGKIKRGTSRYKIYEQEIDSLATILYNLKERSRNDKVETIKPTKRNQNIAGDSGARTKE